MLRVCGTGYGLREGHGKFNNFLNRRILSRLHVSKRELLMGAHPAAWLDVKLLSPPASLAAAPATRLDAGEPLVQLDGNTLLSSAALPREHSLQFRGYIPMCRLCGVGGMQLGPRSGGHSTHRASAHINSSTTRRAV
jgi:hypothetical protein